ncbi:hypothetical protein IMSHALPRED_000111 [Imshaugia aleurites]|uniref:Uncharacterized protein n=1 Tax=Imshaugia aleurites TaxID=172621 RepID=A0A8H3ED06_9LECA|nr:hypothetical protein IMSHALPRED_000111 [Imshaugia aleurites]
MAAPAKDAPRFESFPPEIRNMIYKHLFPPACKELRLDQYLPYWVPQDQYVYVFHTAILRSNHLIGQEAKSVLYGSVVLINWDAHVLGQLRNTVSRQNVAFNHIARGTPLPPLFVQIKHEVQCVRDTRVLILVAAADVRLICEGLHGPCHLHCYYEYIYYLYHIGAPRRASLSLMASPQLGWPYELLLETIWLPLKALRDHDCPHIVRLGHGRLKVVDSTGIFEQNDEISDWEKDFELESNTELHRNSDTEESKSDESDESGSEDNENHELDSDNEEVEEEENERVGYASTSSDEVDSDKDEGDEDGKAGDKSDDGKISKRRSNDPRCKSSHSPASDSGHDGDANAPIVAEDNSVAGGRCVHGPSHKGPADEESNGDVDEIVDKKDT